MSQRVGQEVGLEKIKNNKFWKPKKRTPVSVSSWNSANSYSHSSSYSYSSNSNNSFNTENQVHLVMTWGPGLKEKDIFHYQNNVFLSYFCYF